MSTSIPAANIKGIIACIPQAILDNRESGKELFGDKIESVIKATGITNRAVAEKGTTGLDLGVAAAERLLESTQTALEDIGAVICVTFTPEYLLPADSPAAQSRLGLANTVLAFDISMACSGYGYGLYVSALLANSLNKTVLLLDYDVQSPYISPQDRATYPVMADAGTATLVEPGEPGETWDFGFYTNGDNREVLYIPAGGSKHPTELEDLELKLFDDGSRRKNTDLYMDGFEVFKFVAQKASSSIKQFMTEISLDPQFVDVFVPHQANMYMVDQLSKKLGIEPSSIWKSGNKYGNPASASVPLTIAENASNLLHEDKKALLSGFGAGLSISSALVTLKADASYGVFQYDANTNCHRSE